MSDHTLVHLVRRADPLAGQSGSLFRTDSAEILQRVLAQPRRTQRTWPRGRRVVLSLALAAVLGVAAVPAFGLSGQIGKLFSSSPSAPGHEQLSFASMDKEAPVGMAPGVIAGEAREVIQTTLATGEQATLAVAPTQSGGFCIDLILTSAGGNDLGSGGGCDRDRTLQLAPNLTIPGPIKDGHVLAPPVALSGSVLIATADQLELIYEDGTRIHIPITWVSEPINAGFFVYGIPEAHWAIGHRPTRLIAINASGDEIAATPLEVRFGIPKHSNAGPNG